MPLPLLPRNIKDPTGQDARERKAIADFERRVKRAHSNIKALLERQTYRVLTLNAAQETFKKYEFNVDEFAMDNIAADIARYIDAALLDGGARDLWFLKEYVQPAYQQGTGQAHINLATQAESYAVSRPTLEVVLMSPAYVKRLAYVKAREFENMKGFTSGMTSRVSRVLMDGMAGGQNPKVIARALADELDGDLVRARRIARTEINTALRRARLDEADDATETLGIKTMMMQLSALSATTRLSHALRHSKLYTTAQVRVWMATSPNSINCKCTFVEVLVDDKGKPITPKVISLAVAQREAFVK